jgi:O-antigen ligase
LPATAVYLAISGVRQFCLWTVLLMIATAASLIGCERLEFAGPRWLGWAIMMFVVGPLHMSTVAQRLRHRMTQHLDSVFLVCTMLSFMWWLGGLPNLGRGDFTGVMSHSMTLGPVAAITGILALCRATNYRGFGWFAVVIASFLLVVRASSRAALVAFLLGSLIVVGLRIRKNGVASLAVIFAAIAVAIAPNVWLGLVIERLPAELTSGLARKATINTRELHWQARWDEFLSRPSLGVGFNSAWEDSVGYDSESGAVESGSSYISLLSMTGYIGTTAFALLCLQLAVRVRAHWPNLCEEKQTRICGLAGFWAMHLGAEGYIYGIGSLLGMAFWLWMGHVHDQLQTIQSRAAGQTALNTSAISPMAWAMNPQVRAGGLRMRRSS